MRLTHQDKVFIALGFLSLLPILFVVVTPILRTQNALVQADITLREADEAIKNGSYVEPKYVAEYDSGIKTEVKPPHSYQQRDAGTYTSTPEPTELDRATETAQDCFSSSRDQSNCIPHLVNMQEAAKRDAMNKR